jgi:cytochrome oxidase Cu insertion factor (SCO1/SenC/PrrC family)
MIRRLSVLSLGAVVAAFAACTNGGGLGSPGGSGGATPSPLPSAGIGIAIPTGKIGVENDPVWGTVSGYTQEQTSQVLAFPPGAKITLENLSSTTPHTLNVIAQTKRPPPKWPQNPSLSFSPMGNGVLGAGYASGSLNPGTSVQVTLSNPGIYLIGCAYHYVEFHMRDVIEVVAGATPGPTASPGPGGYAIRPKRARPQSHEPPLVDQRGRVFTLTSLRGEPLVVTFIAAHCTDACPLINAQFSDAARRIQHARIAARLLTVTLDPEHDSPKTMRDLAARFEANPRYWLLAGGSIPNVHAVMREFGAASVEGKRGYHDEHTTFVYVVNARGELVQTMLASSALSDDILEAVRERSLVAAR